MSSRSGVLLVAAALLIPSCTGNINLNHPLISVTDRVSVTASGGEANGASKNPAITPDGRYLAFSSDALNLADLSGLAPGGIGIGKFQIYRKDLLTGAVVVVSQSTGGVLGDDHSVTPSISADGRYIAFSSVATVLLGPGGDLNGVADVFVRDVQSLTTIRVSVQTGAGAEGEVSAFGGGSTNPVISADGTMVTFTSDLQDIWSTLLVNFDTNVFRHPNAPTGTTDLVSVNFAGVESSGSSGGPSISANGQFVAFWSDATDLLAAAPTAARHVYVRDMTGGTTELESVSTAGVQADASSMSDQPSLSADGSRLVFRSNATNLDVDVNLGNTDIFLRIRGVETRLISKSSAGIEAIGSSYSPAISGDGGFVVFASDAANLVSDDTNGVTDVFWLDTSSGLLLRASVGTYGAQANGPSGAQSTPAITFDGRVVIFDSQADNLIAADGNSLDDLFSHGPMY